MYCIPRCNAATCKTHGEMKPNILGICRTNSLAREKAWQLRSTGHIELVEKSSNDTALFNASSFPVAAAGTLKAFCLGMIHHYEVLGWLACTNETLILYATLIKILHNEQHLHHQGGNIHFFPYLKAVACKTCREMKPTY